MDFQRQKDDKKSKPFFGLPAIQEKRVVNIKAFTGNSHRLLINSSYGQPQLLPAYCCSLIFFCAAILLLLSSQAPPKLPVKKGK